MRHCNSKNDTIWYWNIYSALENWHRSELSLPHCTKSRKNNGRKVKQKMENLRSYGSNRETIESVLKEEESMVRKLSGKGRFQGDSETGEGAVDEERRFNRGSRSDGSRKRRVGRRTRFVEWNRKLLPEIKWKAHRKEQSDIHRDDVGGRVKVTRDEEQVLRGGWTVMRWCRYEGWGCENFVGEWEEFVFDAFRYLELQKDSEGSECCDRIWELWQWHVLDLW